MSYNVILAFNAPNKPLLASSTFQLVAVSGIALGRRGALGGCSHLLASSGYLEEKGR